MKLNKNLNRNIWKYLIIFAITTLSFLWIFQVLFLDVYYELMKTNEISALADEMIENYEYNTLNFDLYTYKKGICIDVVVEGSDVYSSNNLNRGCLGINSRDYLEFKSDFINSNKTKKIYKISNREFNNKTVMCGIKLNDNLYVFINSPVEILSSTTKILASQLIIVTILVLILSLIISYFISKKISKPIIEINNTAKKMAKGNYDIEFKIDENIKELNELVETLNETNKTLAETDSIRRELLANISHDLKTPLTMIKAYSEMIRDLSYENKEKTMKHLNTIIDETDRLNLLVNDILELSKMQSKTEELKIEEFDLNELIKSIIKQFNYLKEQDICSIEYKNNKKALIKADKKKIEQVIYNLISNASNYVGNDKLIIIKLNKNNSNYKVEIIDHGKGIDEENLKLIWDKYYKIDKTYKRNTKGTGLGLSIVKNILEMHNFEYGVNSKIGEGTTFYFETKDY